MKNLILYHVSNKTPITQVNHILGKIFSACIECRAFVVGYNILEVVNDSNMLLLALLMRDSSELKEKFESLTDIKLIKVEKFNESSQR